MNLCWRLWPLQDTDGRCAIHCPGWRISFSAISTRSCATLMSEAQIVNPEQKSAYDSPWAGSERLLRILWEVCWAIFCAWTPKPLNEWRLFWLGVFEARVSGQP